MPPLGLRVGAIFDFQPCGVACAIDAARTLGDDALEITGANLAKKLFTMCFHVLRVEKARTAGSFNKLREASLALDKRLFSEVGAI